MSKLPVWKLAKQAGIETSKLMDSLKAVGYLDIKPMSKVDVEEVTTKLGLKREAVKELETEQKVEAAPIVAAAETQQAKDDAEELRELREIAALAAAQRLAAPPISVTGSIVIEQKRLEREYMQKYGGQNKEWHGVWCDENDARMMSLQGAEPVTDHPTSRTAGKWVRCGRESVLMAKPYALYQRQLDQERAINRQRINLKPEAVSKIERKEQTQWEPGQTKKLNEFLATGTNA